jgi:ABC-type sugar transport system permease subunit
MLFVTFRLYPLLDGLCLSFTNARLGRTQYAFVGLANYERLLEDTRFHVSLWNTAFYTVASTLPILAIPSAAPCCWTGESRCARSSAARSFSLHPIGGDGGARVALAPRPVVGPFNYYLKTAGVPVRSWLADPSTAMWAIILTQSGGSPAITS